MVVRSAAGLGGNGCEGGVRLRPATPSCTADQQQRHMQPEHFATLKAKGGAGPLSVNLLTVHTPILGFPLGRPFHKCGTRNVNSLYDWMRYAGASMVRSYAFLFVV